MTRNPNKSTAEELEAAEFNEGLARRLKLGSESYWKDRAKSLRSDYAREGW